MYRLLGTKNKEVSSNNKDCLSMCDTVTRKFIEVIDGFHEDIEVSNTKGYKLLDTNSDSIIELYRVVLNRVFGHEAHMPYRMRSIECLVPLVLNSLSEYTDEAKSAIKTTVSEYAFIQVCISILIKAQKRMEVRCECQKYMD